MPPLLMRLTRDYPNALRIVSSISLASSPSPSFVTSCWKSIADIGNERSTKTLRTLPEDLTHPPTGPIPPTSPTSPPTALTTTTRAARGPTTPTTTTTTTTTTMATRSLQTMPKHLTFRQSSGKMVNFCQRSINDASTKDYASYVVRKATWLRSAQSPSRLTPQTLKLALPRRALIPRLKILWPRNQKNNQQPQNHAAQGLR